MKFSFFSVLGCSLRKSSLSPMSLSKVYANVSLSKIISGSEVRYICNAEMDMYEATHRSFAKSIQQLPPNCPDSACLASLGWLHVQSHVDKYKLLFLWRLLNLSMSYVFKQVFIVFFMKYLPIVSLQM